MKKYLAKAIKGDFSDSSEILVKVIQMMEDDSLLNAGTGSNLTQSGTVECDASIMTLNEYGSIAATSGVKYPIKAAYQVLLYSRIQSHFGLTPPLCLSGKGVLEFLKEVKCDEIVVDEDLLITKASRRKWIEIREILNNDVHSEDIGLDTVGAVVIDSNGKITAGSSSGGILYKKSGRIGSAATYGGGIWVSEKVGVSCSGEGEKIIRGFLGKSISEGISDGMSEGTYSVDDHEKPKDTHEDISYEIEDLIQDTLQDKIQEVFGDFEKGGGKAGVVGVCFDRVQKVFYIHNTPSFAVGWICKNEKGVFSDVFVSRGRFGFVSF